MFWSSTHNIVLRILWIVSTRWIGLHNERYNDLIGYCAGPQRVKVLIRSCSHEGRWGLILERQHPPATPHTEPWNVGDYLKTFLVWTFLARRCFLTSEIGVKNHHEIHQWLIFPPILNRRLMFRQFVYRFRNGCCLALNLWMILARRTGSVAKLLTGVQIIRELVTESENDRRKPSKWSFSSVLDCTNIKRKTWNNPDRETSTNRSAADVLNRFFSKHPEIYLHRRLADHKLVQYCSPGAFGGQLLEFRQTPAALGVSELRLHVFYAALGIAQQLIPFVRKLPFGTRQSTGQRDPRKRFR